MADQNKGSGTVLAFIVGALVVVVAVLGWIVLGGDVPGGNDAEITIDLPDSVN